MWELDGTKWYETKKEYSPWHHFLGYKFLTHVLLFVSLYVTVWPEYTLNMKKKENEIFSQFGKTKSHICRQCVCVNYARKQLVNGVPLSRKSWHLPVGFQGQDTYFIAMEVLTLIKTYTFLHTHTIDFTISCSDVCRICTCPWGRASSFGG